MNFFEQSKRAKKISNLLMLIFLIYIPVFALFVHFVFAGILNIFILFLKLQAQNVVFLDNVIQTLWSPEAFFATFIFFFILMGGAYLYKRRALKQGGQYLASLMNAKRLFRKSATKKEKILFNIMEEIAISSGARVPYLYILSGDNHGLNAFAAGFGINDAAIGVTEQALSVFSREELQAVIAHEFSHVINYDCRTNMHMTAVLYGMDIVYIAGQSLSNIEFTDVKRNDGGAYRPLIILGELITAFGEFGHLCVKLIQACFSRQKEYLADAEAVRFTRNPNALASALKKIFSYENSSFVSVINISNIKHFFFADSQNYSQKLLSTHPPLTKRILIVDPSFDGKKINMSNVPTYSSYNYKSMYVRDRKDVGIYAENIIDLIGHLPSFDKKKMDSAISSLPSEVFDLAKEPYGARGLINALFLVSDEEISSQQVNAIIKESDSHVKDKTGHALKILPRIDSSYYLLLTDIALQEFNELSKFEIGQFEKLFKKLFDCKKGKKLFDYTLLSILEKRFKISIDNKLSKISVMNNHRLIEKIIFVIAYHGHQKDFDRRKAFEKAISKLGKDAASYDSFVREYQDDDFRDLYQAIKRSNNFSMTSKKLLLESASACVLSDENVTIEEIEAIRMLTEVYSLQFPQFLFLM